MLVAGYPIARRALRVVVAAGCLLGSFDCAAATCIVNSALDDPGDASAKVTAPLQSAWSGAQKNVATLRDCIVASNLMTGYDGMPTAIGLTIELSKINGSTIVLQDNLPLLFNNVSIVTTTGKPVAISGNYAHRIFFASGLPPFKSSNVPDPDGAQPITVTLSNLVLEYGEAHGGDGAGGGMGAGGALFVNKNATVTLANVALKQNIAIGGNPLNLDDYPILSGGGMGTGASVSQGGGSLGGPGVYASGAGIGTPGTSHFPGGFGGTGIGQLSINQNFSQSDFDVDTGSGTLGGLIGGGGLVVVAAGDRGNAGGFGGGGAYELDSSTGGLGGGNGGFGGGGAWAEDAGQSGGNGGFGGGGGGGLFFTTSGNGGFGAGAGATGDFSNAGISGVGGGIASQGPYGGGYFGGGGAGLGGAIFVRSGGTLQIQSTSSTTNITGNMVLAGGQDTQAASIEGAAAGSGIFVMTGAITVFNVATRYIVYDDIADDSLLSLPVGQTYVQGNGSGAIVRKTGAGILVIDSVDTRAGFMGVQSGTLAGIGMIAGPVSLGSSARLLPGDPLINGGIGTLTVGSLTWNAGGAMAYQLGADDSVSDHLQIDGALLKLGSGPFLFYFGTGATPPVIGQTYRLISASDTSAFSSQDFSFVSDSSLQSLNGKFSTDATGVYFSVTAVQP